MRCWNDRIEIYLFHLSAPVFCGKKHILCAHASLLRCDSLAPGADWNHCGIHQRLLCLFEAANGEIGVRRGAKNWRNILIWLLQPRPYFFTILPFWDDNFLIDREILGRGGSTVQPPTSTPVQKKTSAFVFLFQSWESLAYPFLCPGFLELGDFLESI